MNELVSRQVPRSEAELQVAQRDSNDSIQVQLSWGSGHIDLFVPQDQWLSPSIDLRQELARATARAFNTNPAKLDWYQGLRRKPGYPDPATNVPPGSIRFQPDGAVLPPEQGDVSIRLEIEQSLP